MSLLKRDRVRKKLRDALSITHDEPFLQMIWAVDALRSGREELAGRLIEFPASAVGENLGDELAIYPWELETLCNLLLTVPKKFGQRTYLCRSFNAASEFTNYLRRLEGAEFVVAQGRANIFNEMHRIGQRQFPWQRDPINKSDFYRYILLYGQGRCAEHFEATHGLSVSQFAMVGFALFALFMQRPYTEGVLDLTAVDIAPEILDAGLRLLSIQGVRGGETLQKMIEDAGAATWPAAYRPSLLRRYPVLSFGPRMDRLRAPLPRLLIQRITSGLYYDLVAPGGDLRNEISDRFESYCADYLTAMAPRFAVSRAYRYQGLRKGVSYDSPDILVRDGNRLVLAIECKATKLTFAGRFSENPTVDARERYAEIGKGVFQLWRYFSHCRRGLSREGTGNTAAGLVLTLDTWLVMARPLQQHVFEVASALADTDPEIIDADRRPIVFAAIQDFERLVEQSDEDGILQTIASAQDERFLGWLLPDIRRALNDEPPAKKVFPFDPGDLLPWWNAMKGDLSEDAAN